MIVSILQSVKNWFVKPSSTSEKNDYKLTNSPLVHDLRIPDEEIWNLVTNYGEYREIWPIYRNCGLVEAIKIRDEKIKFDRNLLEKNSSNTSSFTPKFNSHGVKNNYSNSKLLDELDSALIKGLASYFQDMPDKILHYHNDHNATKEEAEVIARYYFQTADKLIQIKTENDLINIIQEIENLKKTVSRYQHESMKYRWSYELDKKVLEKLKSIK
jgi:hypothetical protein